MSKKGVAGVMGRATVDRQYREMLKRNPLDAMEGYELDSAEKQAIAGIDHRELDRFADALNRRLRDWFVAWAAK